MCLVSVNLISTNCFLFFFLLMRNRFVGSSSRTEDVESQLQKHLKSIDEPKKKVTTRGRNLEDMNECVLTRVEGPLGGFVTACPCGWNRSRSLLVFGRGRCLQAVLGHPGDTDGG